MTSLELLQEIDAWLSFNNHPSKEQINELRKDIKKCISEQLNISVVQQSEQLKAFLSVIIEEFDSGGVSWETRDSAESLQKNYIKISQNFLLTNLSIQDQKSL